MESRSFSLTECSQIAILNYIHVCKWITVFTIFEPIEIGVSMVKRFLCIFLFVSLATNVINADQSGKTDNPPIYIAFQWHMHQPIYYPAETVIETEQNDRYPYSLFEIFDQRSGPYTHFPSDAIQKGINAGFPHFGAQISFSGSLIENLNELEVYGNPNFQNWKTSWKAMQSKMTTHGNARMEMVGFGYYHPLMGLIRGDDIRTQIQKHRKALNEHFAITNLTRGMFPPENAFAPRMIPHLAAEGIEWVLIDNIHFERACEGYPFTTEGNLYEPNLSDVRNPNPNDWIQLTGLWAPTNVSAQWAHQPHYLEYTDPETGERSKIIAIPADRYMGIEDGRGGFGALNYEEVMSQLEPYNTDPDHPILIVLAHDGDNHGGGSSAYYNNNFQDFVDWLGQNSERFVCTTVPDYLEMYPPDPGDVIHVERGSWSGADNGDPEFKKWLADEKPDGYSADRNSWSVITAAKNYVETARNIEPGSQNTKEAYRYLLLGESSDYWYWDYSIDGLWDAHPVRTSNQAVTLADAVIAGQPDNTAPSIFIPQREPYNPGGLEWYQPQSSDFEVWTYAYDVSGLDSVTLRFRTDTDGTMDRANKLYNGGGGVGVWNELAMQATFTPSRTDPVPLKKARKYGATISEKNEVMIDYYVVAVDSNGNAARTPIQHVWVGNRQSGAPNDDLSWQPQNPTKNDSIVITLPDMVLHGYLHWGVNYQGNSWQTPHKIYWPDSTELYQENGPAVESPFQINNSLQQITIGPFNQDEQVVNRIAFVIHYENDTWDNNNGNDYHIDFGSSGNDTDYEMDGNLDEGAKQIAKNGELKLYAHWQSPNLYLASESAEGSGGDQFILLSADTTSMRSAPWAKAGQTVAWSAFMGNENNNNYLAWFDATGTVAQHAGSYFEGYINIEEEFGSIPPQLFLSLAQYESDDGGSLTEQAPAGNNNGDVESFEMLAFDYSMATALENSGSQPATSYALSQNFPNPFNPSTTIAFTIPSSGDVQNPRTTLTVYDITGKEIKRLFDAKTSSGVHRVTFNARSLSSGVYLYQLKIGEFVQTKKMILIQ